MDKGMSLYEEAKLTAASRLIGFGKNQGRVCKVAKASRATKGLANE